MNYKKILLIIAVIVGIFFASNYYFDSRQKQEVKNEAAVLYALKAGGLNKAYQGIEIPANSTVFSLLESLGKQYNFEIETKNYDIGVFIESIAGIKNGQDGKYWQYWVNGNLGEVAADKKIVNPGDTIEWKFEVPNF